MNHKENKITELLDNLKNARIAMDAAYKKGGNRLPPIQWWITPEFTAHQKACQEISDYVIEANVEDEPRR